MLCVLGMNAPSTRNHTMVHEKGPGSVLGRGAPPGPKAQCLPLLFPVSPGDIKQEGAGAFREGPPYQRRGALQLWQFLVALLDDPTNAHFIAWTGRGMEFKLIEPEEVGLSDVSTSPPNSFGPGDGRTWELVAVPSPSSWLY